MRMACLRGERGRMIMDVFNSRQGTMRIILLIALVALTGACSSVEYNDTNAQVDARPECIGTDSAHPGYKPPLGCERKTEATWSSDDKPEPLDLSGKKDKK